jgi:hypothetical protein
MEVSAGRVYAINSHYLTGLNGRKARGDGGVADGGVADEARAYHKGGGRDGSTGVLARPLPGCVLQGAWDSNCDSASLCWPTIGVACSSNVLMEK